MQAHLYVVDAQKRAQTTAKAFAVEALHYFCHFRIEANLGPGAHCLWEFQESCSGLSPLGAASRALELCLCWSCTAPVSQPGTY